MSIVSRSKEWRGRRPKLRFGLEAAPDSRETRLRFHHKKAWIAILIVAGVAVAFTIPAIVVFGDAARSWSELESLFDLVGALFSSFWLLGWSVALCIMYAFLVLLLLAREIVVVRPRTLTIRVEVLGLGLEMEYDRSWMRNLGYTVPAPHTKTSWRGGHMTFDYDGTKINFGSQVSEARAGEIEDLVERFAGPIPSGDVPVEEPQGEPETPEEPLGPDPLSRPGATGPAIPPTLTSPSTLALVAANLVPIAGALFLGWDLGHLMVLFWAETGVVGLYNLVKMGVIGRWAALPPGLFFLGHFGGFMSVHFMFVYFLFVNEASGPVTGSLEAVADLFAGLWLALVSLLVSHGVSFLSNFLGRREFAGRTLQQQMTAPYRRIVVMHVTIMVGGGLVMLLGEPSPALLLLIGLKIVVDLRAHLREHR